MECCQSSETKILKCLICKTCLCANHFQSHEHLINNIKIDISQVSPRNLDIFRRFLLEISIKTEEDYELMRREGIKIINRFENQSQKAVTLIENFKNNVILLKNRIKSLKKNDSGYLVDENLKILMLRPSYLDKYLKNLYFFQIFNKNLDDLHIFTYTNSYDHHINLKQQHEISLKIIEIDRRKVMLNQIQQFYLNLTKKCPEFSKELLAILKETSIMTGNAYIVDSISLTRLIQTDKDLDIIIENNFQVFSHIFTLNSSLKRCEINNFLFIDKS